MVFFKRRGTVTNGLHYINVNITGTGSLDNCYVTIKGTVYTSAVSEVEVLAGDTIRFSVTGMSELYSGKVIIDGVKFLDQPVDTMVYYDWVVPDDISTVNIELYKWTDFQGMYSTITVTTF